MAKEYIAETAVVVRADTSKVKDDVAQGVRDAVGSGDVKRASVGLGDITHSIRGISAEAKPGAAALDLLDGALSGTAGTVALVGGALAIGLGVAALSVDAYEKLAESVEKFRNESGATAETSSRFVTVLGDYGISADTAANSLSFLGRAVETNEKGLTDLGLNVKRTSTGQLDLAATTISLAAAYERTTDPGKRAELIMAALGRQGRDLIPILDKGGEGLKALLAAVPSGQILSDGDIAQAENFKVAINQVHDSMQEIEISLARGIVPSLAAAARGSVPLVNALGVGINDVVIGLRLFTEAARNPTELGNWDQFTAKVMDSAAAVGDLIRQEQAQAETADLMAKSQLSIVDVSLKDQAAHNQLQDAIEGVWHAQADYNDALAGSGKYAEAATTATNNLTSANRSLEQAQRRVRDLTVDIASAQGAVTEAEFRFGPQSKEAADAREALTRKEEDLKDARGGVTDATDKVTEAQKKLADAKDLSDERATAADKLKDARFKLSTQTAATAAADVQLQVVQDGLRGTIDDTTTQVGLYREQLEKLMGPLPQDAINDLKTILGLIPSGDQPAGSLSPSQLQQFVSIPQGSDPAAAAAIRGEAPIGTQGTVGAGGLGAAVGAGGVSGGTAVGAGSLQAPVNVTINYPVDWQQMIEQAEYASGVR